jgi:hypothetical protein
MSAKWSPFRLQTAVSMAVSSTTVDVSVGGHLPRWASRCRSARLANRSHLAPRRALADQHREVRPKIAGAQVEEVSSRRSASSDRSQARAVDGGGDDERVGDGAELAPAAVGHVIGVADDERDVVVGALLGRRPPVAEVAVAAMKFDPRPRTGSASQPVSVRVQPSSLQVRVSLRRIRRP